MSYFKNRRTFVLKEKQVNKNWLLIDAKNLKLGRISAEISKFLRGKHKPEYTPHMDCGDYVVVINAEKVALTGNKHEDIHYHHTGYVGGIKAITKGKMLSGKYPERVLMLAVKRMLGKGPLGRKQLTHLKVYAGSEHPHTAQSPVFVDLAAMNSKNSA